MALAAMPGEAAQVSTVNDAMGASAQRRRGAPAWWRWRFESGAIPPVAVASAVNILAGLPGQILHGYEMPLYGADCEG